MDSPLAVLLRDGDHTGSDAATNRLALKAEQVSVSYSRSVIQVPIVQTSPILMDMGMVRPALTISGIIDTVGGDQTNTTSGFQGMESMTISSQTYYIPYKNFLEQKLVTWITNDGYDLQLEIGDATTPEGANQTGGGIYKVAVQQIQFSIAPGMEDRWIYSIQFVAKFREGISF